MGEFRRALELYEEAYSLYLEEGLPRRAAMSAFGIAALAFMSGDEAFASGWLSRAMRLLETQPPSAEHGYLLFMETAAALEEGDLPSATKKARQLQVTGGAFSDPNLVALGLLSEGLALIKQAALNEGMRLLDEAVLDAVSDKLSPEWAGYIYCKLMVTCHEVGDLQRAREWTEATHRWSESLQGSGPFLGVCRVYRAHLFQVQGAWDVAEAEAAKACEELAGFDVGTR